MKIKSILITIFLCLGIAMVGANLSGCSAGARIGPVGAGASIH